MGFGYTASVVLLTAIAVSLVPKLLTPTVPANVTTETAPGWEKLADTFKDIIEENPARGYAFSVFYKGEMVVDMYGGYSDIQAWVPWQQDTLNIMFSATKGIAAICIALLVDRGLLEYGKPIAEYWPEFDDEGHGRESITIDMLLSHQAGLVTLDKWSIFDLVNDPEKVTNLLLTNKPDWEPGTKHGYHLITYGLYINELIKRVDPQHRTLDQFFMEEVAEPLELDAMIGLPLEENYRVARILPYTMGLEDLKGLLLHDGWRMIAGLLNSNSLISRGYYTDIDMDGIINNPEFRRAPLGASHAFGTARAFAKLYGILSAGGTYNNKLFMSEDIIKGMTDILASGVDQVLGIPISYGRGTVPVQTPYGSIRYGFPGAGGIAAYGDLTYKLGFTFTTTKIYPGLISNSPQYARLEKIMYECVKNIERQS